MDDLFDGFDLDADRENAPISSAAEDVLAELDTITAPADDPAPLVAEFAVTPATADALAASGTMAPELRALVETTRDELRADAVANGWTAKARKAVDAHRAGPGRQDYNANRRAKRAREKLDQTGKLPRAYGTPAGPEKQKDRQDQLKEAQQRRRAKVPTSAQSEARAERRRQQRARERIEAEAAATMEKRAIF